MFVLSVFSTYGAVHQANTVFEFTFQNTVFEFTFQNTVFDNTVFENYS